MANKDFDSLMEGAPVAGISPTTDTMIKPAPMASSKIDQVTADTYSDDEITDVNSITVTIPDTQTPIVVLFGSPASGKTLVLLRMIRYLESQGYQVVPESVFRPEHDVHYKRMCDGLKTMAYSAYTPGGTDVISFMLLKVLDNSGHPICQILEAPGEHYFNGEPNLNFPTYINGIVEAANRKVWVFLVEQDWGRDQGVRNMYAQKICAMQKEIPNDKVVFLFNKVDKHMSQYKRNGLPDSEVFFTNIKNQYPEIFSAYRNTGLMRILYGEYNFRTVCFSSGKFTYTSDKREVWTLGKDWYCEELWKAIK